MQLSLSSASAVLPGGVVVPAVSIQYDSRDEAQTVTLTFAKALPAGTGERGTTLRLAFSGVLNDKMAGFYRSAYSAPGGVTRHMGVTQFEATDARRAFPCWDEPALKATFDVTLRVPADREALGNMPPLKSAPASAAGGPAGWKDVAFARTPLMSTYLVAWVVGEFDVVEDVTAEGVVVRVWTPPGLGEQGRFALKVGTHALSFFTRYFGASFVTDIALSAARALTRSLSILLFGRRAVPAAQAGHGGGRGLCRRRDGELGPRHLPYRARAVRPGNHRQRGEAAERLRRLPRAGAPVVRQPRHHGVRFSY